MGALLAAGIVALVAVPVAVNRWIRSRSEVDDYYERDHRDPPAFGTPSSPGGGGL